MHASYKEASGWYLAAWRDFVGMTLEELAEQVGTSKGVVSDLETGARRSNGALAQRFNKDDVERFARALSTTGGDLLDTNPFAGEPDLGAFMAKIRRLGSDDRKYLEELADRLLGSD